MPLLAVARPSGDQLTVDEIRATLSRRFEASSYPPCPVDFVSGYVGMCAAQSCGKCTPCRVGLPKLQALLERVLDGTASERTIDEIEKLSEDIYNSADCAIGYDAASTAWRALQGFREDFLGHVRGGQCAAEPYAAIPCMRGCPARVDIPGYLALVAEGRYQDAVRLIRKDNPFPLACGLICEHPCEPECRRNYIDDAVNIRAIKRFAVDHSDNDYTPFHYESTGKKIAVIGGGPAGMSAAYFLALMGHAPTVFEQRDNLGGMMRYGIP
ncbi:MAG: NAD(P)-binding protein, partial [Eggerthellaceae bacterium]|nr:NAD(P)-binding protein [Eggerthellaceae bacterium]